MLNDSPVERCWSYRAYATCGSYCSNHEEYPNLNVTAKTYAGACHQRTQKVCSIDELRQRYFPSTAAEFPIDEDSFLAYLCRISGHVDLWLVTYAARCDEHTREAARRIVEMLLPFIGDAKTNAARVYHILSDWDGIYARKQWNLAS